MTYDSTGEKKPSTNIEENVLEYLTQHFWEGVHGW